MEPKQKQRYSDCYTSILNIKSRDKTANEMYGTKHAVFGGVLQITQRFKPINASANYAWQMP